MVGEDGMKIDRMYFDQFEETVKKDAEIKKMIERKDLDGIEQYILQHIFDKPEDYFNISQLRDAAKVDRRISLREIIEKILDIFLISKVKMNCWKKNLKNLTPAICRKIRVLNMQRIFSKVTLPILNSGK